MIKMPNALLRWSLSCTLSLIATSATALATNYYIDATAGNDSNQGTSAADAWQTLDKANSTTFLPGDQLLLKRGESFIGKIYFDGDSGTAASPIIIADYGSGVNPVIDAGGYIAGIHLENSNHIEVNNLEITANGGTTVDGSDATARSGVYIRVLWNQTADDITLNNLYIHDVYPELDVASEGCNPTTYKGYGVQIAGNGNTTANFPASNITIEGCTIERVGYTAIYANRVETLDILNNQLTDIGGPGILPTRSNDVVVRGNNSDGTGSYIDSRMHGRGSGIWPWTCERVLIEKNTFTNAMGREDSCGIHIDFGNKDVVVQYNLSVNNAGGFIEVLGNNYNCSYRYNVSINDGWRVAGVTDQGSIANNTNGRTLFISGFVGANDGVPNDYVGPYDTYIYNNTIYTSPGQTCQFTIHGSALGILISNNIFYLEGPISTSIKSWKANGSWINSYDQTMIDTVVWENNIYENSDSQPLHFPFGDSAPIITDPLFVNTGGLTTADYIPQAHSQISDQGVTINNIPGDPLGLLIGLTVTEDIAGSAISGQVDLGAIELVQNAAPTWSANPFTQTAAVEDTSYTSYLAWRVSDVENDALTIQKVSGPAWASISPTGMITGNPTQADVGNGFFTVSVSDGINDPVLATMNLAVTNVNDTPTFTVDPIVESNATENVAYTGSLAGAATDVDGDVLTYSVIAGPAWLNVASDGTLSGTPADTDVGIGNWTIEVNDGNNATATASLSITVDAYTNQAPVWSGDPLWASGATEDTSYGNWITWAVTDTENDTLTYSMISGPTWISLSSGGQLTGTPTQADVGVATLTVSVSDGVNAPVTTTVKLNVTAIDDAPIWSIDPINADNAMVGNSYSDSLTGLASDEEGAVTYAKVSGPTWLSVASDGTLSGTPSVGDVGSAVFTVSASDGLNTINATLNITVDAAPLVWIDILTDDFETDLGNWTDGGSDCMHYTGQKAPADASAVRLRDDTNTSVVDTADLALSSKTEIQVVFDYQTVSMDNSNEDFWLQISTDGGATYTTVEEWNLDDEFANNTIYTNETVLITGITLTDQTRLRFRCDASANNDSVYIDNITVSVK